MRKVVMSLAGGAVAAVAALVAAPPAEALPIASGSFTLQSVLGGEFTVNTGNITAATTTVTEPALVVNDVSTNGNLNTVIQDGDGASLSKSTLPIPSVPPALPTSITPFTITIDGLVFTFDTMTSNNPITASTALKSGVFDVEYDGTLSNGNGKFQDGTPVAWSQTCTQARIGASIGCGSSSVIITFEGPPGTVETPEPATLTLLGASLLGFGLLWRRRTL